MEMNVGCLDRFVRIFLGVVLLGMALYGAIGCWGLVGILIAATGLSGMDPVYFMIGFSTDSPEKAH